jgi:hypothetical protein
MAVAFSEICFFAAASLTSTAVAGNGWGGSQPISAACAIALLAPPTGHLEQLSGDGAQVARIIASADFHPERISERLLSVQTANRPAHVSRLLDV